MFGGVHNQRHTYWFLSAPRSASETILLHKISVDGYQSTVQYPNIVPICTLLPHSIRIRDRLCDMFACFFGALDCLLVVVTKRRVNTWVLRRLE